MATASSSTAPSDCIKAIQHYVNKILKPKDKTKEITGMKCLLLDKETKGMVAMVYSMNDILSKEVYLVDNLEGQHESTGHMKAVVLVRPSSDTIRELVRHLKEPKFTEYHIFFTNIVPQDLLRKIADADHMSVVKQVQEYYCDYYAVNPDLFTLNLGGTLTLSRPKNSYAHSDEMNLKRCTSALLSVLLSFKIKPYVRYLASSESAAYVAREVAGTVGGERELFTFQRGNGSPLLLIMDRREDPITPLLTQWTYQAMVHELLPGGIKNNRVDMKHVQGVSKDLEEVVLSPADDAFFHDNLYSNFGDLAMSIKGLLDDYTISHKGAAENVTSIEDMQRFVDKYPELKSKGLAVGKHVALMTEMSAAVDKKGLMEMSALEQDIVAGTDNPIDQCRDIIAMLSNTELDPFDILRLVMVYTLRYERSKPDKVSELRKAVNDRADMRGTLDLVDEIIRYSGSGVRSCDLFGTNASVFSKLTQSVKKGLNTVQNVYTQHQPLLTNILDQLAKNKLSRTIFPFVGAEPPPGKFSTVIVFYIGGVTYEEAAKAASINNGSLSIGGGTTATPTSPGPSSSSSSSAPFRVVIGGTTIHNAKSFLAELQRLGNVAVDMNSNAGGVGDLR